MKKMIIVFGMLAVLIPLIAFAARGTIGEPRTVKTVPTPSGDWVEISIVEIDGSQFAVATSKNGVGICQVVKSKKGE